MRTRYVKVLFKNIQKQENKKQVKQRFVENKQVLTLNKLRTITTENAHFYGVVVTWNHFRSK